MRDFHIWEGIYSSFEAAGGSTRPFREALWVGRSTQKALQILAGATTPGLAPFTTRTTEYCVPVIAALLQARKRHVRVLDFGGNVGFSVRSIVGALASPDAVEIHVIDNEEICAAGRKVFEGDARVFFHTEIPGSIAFDLVHCGNSIQYSSDWSAVVQSLVASSPDFLVFDDLPAGDNPAFVTLQAYYGEQIPHWFFNVQEFVDTVTRVTGYTLCYKARFLGTFLGKIGPFPMDNFPEDHRIENAYNLAFVRP